MKPTLPAWLLHPALVQSWHSLPQSSGAKLRLAPAWEGLRILHPPAPGFPAQGKVFNIFSRPGFPLFPIPLCISCQRCILGLGPAPLLPSSR